jgi:hypothetical protein
MCSAVCGPARGRVVDDRALGTGLYGATSSRTQSSLEMQVVQLTFQCFQRDGSNATRHTTWRTTLQSKP